jgi:hypothetical protein
LCQPKYQFLSFSVVAAPGILTKQSTPINRDDDLPSVEEISGSILRKKISTEKYQNPEDALWRLEKPILDTGRIVKDWTMVRRQPGHSRYVRRQPININISI